MQPGTTQKASRDWAARTARGSGEGFGGSLTVFSEAILVEL